MELEQPMVKESHGSDAKMELVHEQSNVKGMSLAATGSREISDDMDNRLETFRILTTGVPAGSSEKKLAWLRSQIIGDDVEFETPFGKRRLTYADYTASGRCLHYVENYIIGNVLPFYGNTHTSDSYVGHQTTKMVHEASMYVKTCLGGKDEDAILFVGSGTTAAIKRLQEVMGIAVPPLMRSRALASLRNEERWVVFVGPYEHHSNLLSWRQSLAEVVEIGLDDNGLLDIEALRRELESFQLTNRPILGSFSACSNVTGIYTDTRALASLLHLYGAFACFDFAASGPYVEIDMRSGELDGYDAIFLSPHKFIGGPGTPGVLLMSKVLYQLRSSPPSTCGGGTVSFVNGFNEKDTLYYEDVEEREDAGTPPIIQKVRVALAFWVKEYIGYEVIKAQEHNFIERALDRLLSNPNIWVLGNTSVKRQAIVSFLVFSTTNSSADMKNKSFVDGNGARDGGIFMWREAGNMRDKPLHGPFVAKLLNDLFGIQARGGCACAGPYGHHLLHVDEPHSLAFKSAIQKGYSGVKPGWTRINFAYHLSAEEFEFILAALEFIAIYGQRFLVLYDFNWKTGNWTLKKKSYKEIVAIQQRKKDFNNLLISRALQAASFEDTEAEVRNTTIDTQTIELINKYVSYLETAKRIAHALPKFPPRRKVPKEIDLGLVHFRV